MTGPERASGEARERIRSQLEHGAPWDACDTFRDARAAHPDDAGLLYWGALAHARAGATHEAHALLDRAQAAAAGEPDLLPDILSLRGRLWKDAFHRAPASSGAAAAAEGARREYLAAYALHGDPYPGVNAASLSLLLGDRRDAQRIAREVAAALAARTTPLSHWDHATAGEAHLLLGDVDAARDALQSGMRERIGGRRQRRDHEAAGPPHRPRNAGSDRRAGGRCPRRTSSRSPAT